MEFSKKITLLSWTVALILTGLSCAGIAGAEAPLPYVWAEVTTVQGFYLWKAKNENRSKYALLFVEEIADRYGIEAAIRVAEAVLKD